MRRIPAASLAAVAVLAVSLGLAGCTASGRDSAGSRAEPGIELPAQGESGSAPDAGGSTQDADGAAVDLGAREVVRVGTMTLTVEDPRESVADAIRIVDAAGGRVDDRSETIGDDAGTSTAALTLRIPAARFDAALDDLAGLGELQDLSTSATDVTGQAADLDARIDALAASVDRLTALIAGSADTEDLIALEQAISSRQGELDSLRAQRTLLDDQVSMSSLDLALVSTAVAPEPEPGTFVDGLVTGWNALTAFLGGLLVVTGVLVPWLVPIAVIAGAVVLVVRRRRRRASPAA